MQSVSYRIWTPVEVFISYDDNHYTSVTSRTIWVGLIDPLEGFYLELKYYHIDGYNQDYFIVVFWLKF